MNYKNKENIYWERFLVSAECVGLDYKRAKKIWDNLCGRDTVLSLSQEELEVSFCELVGKWNRMVEKRENTAPKAPQKAPQEEFSPHAEEKVTKLTRN